MISAVSKHSVGVVLYFYKSDFVDSTCRWLTAWGYLVYIQVFTDLCDNLRSEQVTRQTDVV